MIPPFVVPEYLLKPMQECTKRYFDDPNIHNHLINECKNSRSLHPIEEQFTTLLFAFRSRFGDQDQLTHWAIYVLAMAKYENRSDLMEASRLIREHNRSRAIYDGVETRAGFELDRLKITKARGDPDAAQYIARTLAYDVVHGLGKSHPYALQALKYLIEALHELNRSADASFYLECRSAFIETSGEVTTSERETQQELERLIHQTNSQNGSARH